MKLLQGILGLYAQRADWFAGLLLAHIGLALTVIAMSGMIGLLTGIWIAEHPRIAPPVMGVCNVLYTICLLYTSHLPLLRRSAAASDLRRGDGQGRVCAVSAGKLF